MEDVAEVGRVCWESGQAHRTLTVSTQLSSAMGHWPCHLWAGPIFTQDTSPTRSFEALRPSCCPPPSPRPELRGLAWPPETQAL